MTFKLALILEDDYDASVILDNALGLNGYETEVIHHGDVALNLLDHMVPDIVLLDLHTQQADGLGILQYIREDERLQDTLVICVSADDDMADMLQGHADIVLGMPLMTDELTAFFAQLDSQNLVR